MVGPGSGGSGWEQVRMAWGPRHCILQQGMHSLLCAVARTAATVTPHSRHSLSSTGQAERGQLPAGPQGRAGRGAGHHHPAEGRTIQMVTGSRPGAGELERKLGMEPLADSLTRVRAERSKPRSPLCLLPSSSSHGHGQTSIPWQNSGQRPEKGMCPMNRKI